MSLAFSADPPALTRQTTLVQRNALRLLHLSPLVRSPNGNWYGRHFPEQAVRNDTLQALAQRGLARIESFAGLYEERACAVLTPKGHAERCGVRLTADKPPPVALDVVLRDVEAAIRILDAESAAMQAAIQRETDAARDARRRLGEIEAFCARAEARIARIEAERETINRRRTDLRAVVTRAAERVGQSLQESGR